MVEKVSSSPSLHVELVLVVAVDGPRQPRAAQDHHVGAGDGGDDLVAAAVEAAPDPRPDLAVAEPHHPLVPHPDRAGDPHDAAQDVGAAVPQRHEIGHLHHPRVGLVGRLQDEAVVAVAAGRRRPAHGSDQPAAVLRRAQERGEAGGRVEPGQAEPVHGAVTTDEGGGARVAQDGVVLDRKCHDRTVCPAPEDRPAGFGEEGVGAGTYDCRRARRNPCPAQPPARPPRRPRRARAQPA